MVPWAKPWWIFATFLTSRELSNFCKKKNIIGIINKSIFFLQVLSLSLVWLIEKKVLVLMTSFLILWLNAIYWWTYKRPKWPLWKASLLIADIREHSKQDTSTNQQSADTSTVWRHVTDTAEWLKQHYHSHAVNKHTSTSTWAAMLSHWVSLRIR